MMFETAAIDEWTGRFLVWMYCIQPKAMPPRHTTRPIRRTAEPVREPPMNDTAFRSGILMSDSLARSDGTEDTANAAAMPNCQTLGNFMLKGRGLVWVEPAQATGSGRVFCDFPHGVIQTSESRLGSQRDDSPPWRGARPPGGCRPRHNSPEE